MSYLLEIHMAFSNVFRHRRRSLMLGAAIGSVMALFTLVNGIAHGVRAAVIDTATVLVTGHVNVNGFYKTSTGQAVPTVTSYRELLAHVKRALPEQKYAVARGRGWGRLVSDSSALSLSLEGIDVADESGLGRVLEIPKGGLEQLREPDTIVLFDSQARALNVAIGDVVTITAPTVRGAANAIDCRVVAIARGLGLLSKWTALVNATTLRALYQLRHDATGAIQIYLAPNAVGDAPMIAARLRRSLGAAGHTMLDPVAQPFWARLNAVSGEDWTGQKLDVTSWEDELSYVLGTLNTLRGFANVIIVVLLVVVLTGIMNTMWIAIRERQAEIGTLRALGMDRAGVLRVFVLESAFLGLLSACAGAFAGVLLGLALEKARLTIPVSWQLFLLSERIRFAPDSDSALLAIAFVIAVTSLGAVLPAWQAARRPPLIAIARI